jgi:hypothetical protein
MASNEIEICSNCGREIQRSEQAFLFKFEVVCAECDKKLRIGSMGASITSPEMGDKGAAESSIPKAVAALIFIGITVGALVIGFWLSGYTPWSPFPFKITDIDVRTDPNGMLNSINVSVRPTGTWRASSEVNEYVLIYLVDSKHDIRRIAMDIIDEYERDAREFFVLLKRPTRSYEGVTTIGKVGRGGLRHIYTDYTDLFPSTRSIEGASIHGIKFFEFLEPPASMPVKLLNLGCETKIKVTGPIVVQAQVWSRYDHSWAVASYVFEAKISK